MTKLDKAKDCLERASEHLKNKLAREALVSLQHAIRNLQESLDEEPKKHED